MMRRHSRSWRNHADGQGRVFRVIAAAFAAATTGAHFPRAEPGAKFGQRAFARTFVANARSGCNRRVKHGARRPCTTRDAATEAPRRVLPATVCRHARYASAIFNANKELSDALRAKARFTILAPGSARGARGQTKTAAAKAAATTRNAPALGCSRCACSARVVAGDALHRCPLTTATGEVAVVINAERSQ
ncbi:MAG: hypothetical protein QOC81_1961 [Thermoanaerobaculia bacterium]|jgi:hypothetical protein|nr:hypothetical protein [Thermoanaerobaculia bacterium]